MDPGLSGEDPWVLQPCQPCSCYPNPVQTEFPGAASPACPLPAGCVCSATVSSATSGTGHWSRSQDFQGSVSLHGCTGMGAGNSSGNSSSTSGAALLCWWQLPAEAQLQHWSCSSIHFMAKHDGKGEGGVKSSAQHRHPAVPVRVWRSCCLPLPIPTPKQRGLSLATIPHPP